MRGLWGAHATRVLAMATRHRELVLVGRHRGVCGESPQTTRRWRADTADGNEGRLETSCSGLEADQIESCRKMTSS